MQKTHMVLFHDREAKPLKITQVQADALSQWFRDRNEHFIEMYDDQGKLVDILKKQDIRRVTEIKTDHGDTDNLGYWCSFGGGMHRLGSPCNCSKKYFNGRFDCEVWEFYRKHYPKTRYPQDITKPMREHAMRFFANSNLLKI